MLEGIQEELDVVLEPVLLKQIFRSDGVEMIRLGDHHVPYEKGFRYMAE